MLGEFEEGWREHEWRWAAGAGSFPEAIGPRWTPSDAPPGAGVRVYAEQGIGDEIMFASMLPDLQRTGARVVAKADARLLPLFRRSFAGIAFEPRADTEAEQSPAARTDFCIAAGSLGLHFRRAAADFPGTPYLVADRARARALRARLQDGRLLCGLSWWTASRANGRARSPEPPLWAPLLGVQGVRFVSLQYDAAAAGRDQLVRHCPAGLVEVASIDPKADLDGLAALIEALDLVITIGNSTAHLAGALGKAAWVLLPSAPEWRWLQGRDDSPWYRSVRLFRQPRRGDWSAVFERVAAALAQRRDEPRA
jgi:hypothetical protein